MTRTKESEPPKRYSSWPSNRTPLAILLFVAIGAAVIYWTLVQPREIASNPEKHQGVGQRLELLELMPLTGEARPAALDGLIGRVTLLNCWGTWCPPCRQELPHLAALMKRFEGHKEFQLLAVSYPAGGSPDDIDSLREETAATLKRLGVDIPTYCDPRLEVRNELDRMIGFDGFPTSVLIDRGGVIRAVWVGYWPGMETEVERQVGMLLEEDEKPIPHSPAEK